MTKSKKTSKRNKNLTSERNRKNNNTSSHMLLDHCYAFGLSLKPSVLKKKFLKEGGSPLTYFCPALDPPLGGSGRKTTTLVRDHEYLIPTKFRKHPPSGSVAKADYVFQYIYMH